MSKTYEITYTPSPEYVAAWKERAEQIEGVREAFRDLDLAIGASIVTGNTCPAERALGRLDDLISAATARGWLPLPAMEPAK